MTIGTDTATAARTKPKRTVRSRLLQQQQQPRLQQVLILNTIIHHFSFFTKWGQNEEQDDNASSPVEDSSFSHANRDPKEVHYNHSQRDMDETKSHHMLSENLFQARNQPSKLSYSRHAIDEDDPKLEGETNTAFVGDAQSVDEEAIQSKTLPWRREDEHDVQEQQ